MNNRLNEYWRQCKREHHAHVYPIGASYRPPVGPLDEQTAREAIERSDSLEPLQRFVECQPAHLNVEPKLVTEAMETYRRTRDVDCGELPRQPDVTARELITLGVLIGISVGIILTLIVQAVR